MVDPAKLCHEHLTLEHVNTHGLLFTWTGSDEQLKPIVSLRCPSLTTDPYGSPRW